MQSQLKAVSWVVIPCFLLCVQLVRIICALLLGQKNSAFVLGLLFSYCVMCWDTMFQLMCSTDREQRKKEIEGNVKLGLYKWDNLMRPYVCIIYRPGTMCAELIELLLRARVSVTLWLTTSL